jgi:hypothetical protein
MKLKILHLNGLKLKNLLMMMTKKNYYNMTIIMRTAKKKPMRIKINVKIVLYVVLKFYKSTIYVPWHNRVYF